MTPDQARLRAEKVFKQQERARDGKIPLAEYEANAQAIRERTGQLRALRLAREAKAQHADRSR
jgi:hypothetical protein